MTIQRIESSSSALKPKYRLYVDEVGDPGLVITDERYRYLSLTGLFFDLRYVDQVVHPHLEEIKRRHFGERMHADEPLVLHRKELVNAKFPFQALRDPKTRSAFDRDLLHFIEETEYSVVTVTLDKREHSEKYQVWRYDPYHYCMAVLMERFVLWLEQRGCRGDVMAESRGGREDMRLKKAFRKLYEDGTDFVRAEKFQHCLTSGELKVRPKSGNVACLQLADLIAFPSFKASLNPPSFALPEDVFSSLIAKVLVRNKYNRHPVTGVIDGWGVKRLP